MFPRQVFGLTGSTYLPDFPSHLAQCQLGVRTCLPLRGSSGLSPDSLFILKLRNRGICLPYLGLRKIAMATSCGYSADLEAP
jgi:hypothetical protein